MMMKLGMNWLENYRGLRNLRKPKNMPIFYLNEIPVKPNTNCCVGKLRFGQIQNLNLGTELLNKVLAKDPNNLLALTGLAILSYQTQKFLAAENYITQIENIDPQNADAKELRYNLLVQKKAT